MRSRVAQHIQTFQGLRQHRFDLDRISVRLRIQRVGEIDFAAVDAGRQSLLSQVAVELLQSVTHGRRRRHRYWQTVFELYADLAHSLPETPQANRLRLAAYLFSLRQE